jgi:hypothetical protein
MVHLALADHDDGRYCDVGIFIRASALRRMGLHPDQPGWQISAPYGRAETPG